MEHTLTQKAVTEVIGTAVFLTVILVVTSSSSGYGPAGAAAAIGLALAIMVVVGAAVSGAYFNPAVTLMFFVRDGDTLKLIVYTCAQIIGALLALAFFQTLYTAP